MSVSGLLLGIINIAIVVAVLVLVGVIAKWIFSWLGVGLPELVARIYMIIVALIALYMIVALLFGVAVPFHIIR